MYIEYVTPQRVVDTNYTEYDSKGGDYRPTWLIRTSDWEVVPGHEATDGYHTLSYVWEQSGEKFLRADGEYGLTDEGHHQITKQEDDKLTTYEVSYDKLLKQICQDFDIEYLWYDKICIDQTNKEEKRREIKQMHLIYSNARYTVALIPEINIDNPKKFDRVDWMTKDTKAKSEALRQMHDSLWFQRSWTLEEVMMSTRILVVGRNTHFWSLADVKQGDKRKENEELAYFMLGFKERQVKSANQVLVFAHFRTSTKEHDKVFALANIFADIIDINIDYDRNVSTVMNEFYRHLAEKDLSVMCFGANLLPNGDTWYATTMNSHSLPSWTGVSGLHTPLPIANIALDRGCDYTIDDNMRLHVKCRSYAMRLTKYKKLDVFEDNERAKKADENDYKVITSIDDFDGDESEVLDWSQWSMCKATGCFPTHFHKPDDHDSFLSPIQSLSLTEECDECVIMGVVFDSVRPMTIDQVFAGYCHDYLSPVAKKSPDGSSYRIIGVVLLKHFQYEEPRCSPQEVMDKMFNGLGCETQDFCIS